MPITIPRSIDWYRVLIRFMASAVLLRDYIGDHTDVPREIAEDCLAHAVGISGRKGLPSRYRAGKRGALIGLWGDYICR